MKHLLTKKQIAEINANTQFKVFPNLKFGLYEFHYKNRLFKNMIIYLLVDSKMDDRPLYRQFTAYNNQLDPQIEAAKHYLSSQEYPLRNVLDFYIEFKKQVNVLDKLLNRR